jgi:hypothetical protein
MCGCCWPLAFHDRHTGAFSCAIPTSATFPAPPSAAAACRYGRAISSFRSPLANRTTGMSRSRTYRCKLAVYASPIFPNAADDGIANLRCQRRNWHTQPTVCSFGTYACRKTRSTDRQASVT